MSKVGALKKNMDKFDITVITWLAMKLVVDTAAFIYIIWRLNRGS